MIKFLLIYYNFYIIFIPYFIFWFNFIFFFIEIFLSKYLKKYKIYYYPEKTDSYFINFFIVYPKRLAFEIIYTWKKENFFSLQNLKSILKIFLIFVIIGIPFIYLKILFLYIKKKKNYLVWYEITAYRNWKLIIIKKKIIRNMKKYFSLTYREVMQKAEERTFCGLLLSKETKPHGVAFDKESGIGFLSTTKEQRNQEAFKILEDNGSYLYTQIFKASNKLIEINNVKNSYIREIIKQKTYVLEANYKISKIKEDSNPLIIINDLGKQKLSKIDNNTINLSKKVIIHYKEECVIQTLEEQKNYINEMIDMKLILNKIINNKNHSAQMIYSQKKKSLLEKHLEYCAINKIDDPGTIFCDIWEELNSIIK